MKTFEGKVAAITGGSAGIGAATARRFAQEGARVAIAARRPDKGQAMAREIEASGGEALFVQTDVSSAAEIARFIDAAVARFGRLDCAVNNAGISGPALTPLADVDESAWDEVMNVNLKGVFLSMKYEIPAMLKGGRGAIVNVSSIYGSKPSDVGHAPYCTSKFGIIGLSKTAAVDYAKAGIRVNVVSPGYTHSEMVDPLMDAMPQLMDAVLHRHSAQTRLGDSEDAAEAIVWLCSDAAKFVNGAVLTVDGGDGTRLY